MSNLSYNQTEDQDDDQLAGNKPVKPPRFIKNSLTNVNPHQIVVNLSKTQYDVIQEVVQELGWVVQTSRKSQSWDIMWTDTYIDAQDLFRLHDHQKISHYPAIQVLAKKNLLGKNLMKMKKIFPQDYQYFPSTWSLPSQYGDYMRYDEKLKSQGKKQIYIYKPAASCQGKGIKLLQNAQQMQGKIGIIQTYINNPLVIQNLKFDLRIYVLIYGCDPLRIYIYQQGLARFATQNYQKAKKKNLKDTYVHLTNYAINKLNKKFIFNKDQGNMDKGHKRSLSFIYRYLAKIGVDVAALKKKIQDIIVKTILMSESMLSHMYRLSQPNNLKNDLAFHILGFDVIIDQNYNPFLLQINHTPSFSTDTPLDKKIKKSLIKDTFQLINVNLQAKKQKINQKKQFFQKRSQRKLVKLSNQQKFQLKSQIQNQRSLYQKNNLGGFKRLYPVNKDTEQYYQLQKIKQYSKQLFQQENRMTKLTSSNKISNQYESITGRSYKLSNAKSATISPQNKKYSKYEKLPAVTYKLRQKIPQLRNIASMRQREIKGRKQISISAHFPKTTVKKVQFNMEDIFAQVQKKNYLKTKMVKNNKVLNEQQIDNLYKNSFFPTKQIHLELGPMIFGRGAQKQKSSNRKQQTINQQKKDLLQLNENTIALLRNRQFKQCHDCIFIKKSQLG